MLGDGKLPGEGPRSMTSCTAIGEAILSDCSDCGVANRQEKSPRSRILLVVCSSFNVVAEIEPWLRPKYLARRMVVLVRARGWELEIVKQTRWVGSGRDMIFFSVVSNLRACR